MAHVVQLFDSDDSLAAQVATFLHDGYLIGERLRVIASAEHMAAIARHLGHLGCPVSEALSSNRLRWMDSASILQMLMPDHRLDARQLRSLVRELAAPVDFARAPTRVYGEMVNLLAERGDLRGAVELEKAWNPALSGAPATLLCGYASGHFGDPATSAALNEICHEHDDIRRSSSDLLGSWLVGRH